MYFLYVDESGDTGLHNSPSAVFILSGLVVHELYWHKTLESIINFRRLLKANYGLKLREEIHAVNFVQRPGELARIHKSMRLRLLRDVIDFQAKLQGVSLLNVVVRKDNKQGDYDIFGSAWQRLLQRFHNTIEAKNFPGPKNGKDHGVLIVDKTDEKRLRNITRRMKRYNPVPNMQSVVGDGYRQIPLSTIVEDAVHRESHHSYFIQLCDVNAYFLYQKHNPCAYVKKKGGVNYFDRLDPILFKKASYNDAQGIVRV